MQINRHRTSWNVLDQDPDDIMAVGFSPPVRERGGGSDTQYMLETSWVKTTRKRTVNFNDFVPELETAQKSWARSEMTKELERIAREKDSGMNLLPGETTYGQFRKYQAKFARQGLELLCRDTGQIKGNKQKAVQVAARYIGD